MQGVQVLLFLAVGASVAWLVRMLLQRDAQRVRAVRARGEAEQEAQARLEAVMKRPGLLPDHPLVLDSAAAVEPRAETEPCPICEGRLHVDTHDVDEHGPDRLRKLVMRCGDCGRKSTLYARIEAPTVN